MAKIENGTKIKTKPVTYEIEVLELSREIPKDEEINFIEWLSGQTDECPSGRNHEYFSYNENYIDDIGVKFYIKRA
jgi:hypothetical protein